ncbi:DoxX family protein [Amycolatopsis sp. NBC_01488]|uniref:DoxX family protein n=1 Tax=Amycolatopsis sp. NBC_01488 TaxID=2903563 RepID=UPI002E2BB602|nr:DoxX family protein [Amycolatopsis sp. NBC_01488]
MHTALVVTVIVLNAGIGAADLVKAPFVLATSNAVDVPPSWLPVLGTLKLAGAAGLLAGLLGFAPLGVAAAIGLVLFYVGAIVAHLKARKFATGAAPLLFLGLVAATLL